MNARINFVVVPHPSGSAMHGLLLSMEHVAATFGLIVRSVNVQLGQHAAEVMAALDPYLLGSDEPQEWPGTRLLGERTAMRSVYKVTPASLQLLVAAAATFEEWVNPALPEDLHFMRADGSTVLGTVAQEGELWLELDPIEMGTVAGSLGAGYELVPEESNL